MARPREFDTDTALDGALNVFREHGYEGASLPDLLTGMGLTRGSLYKAFKDKKSLFLTVLERYEDNTVDAAVLFLTDDTIPDGWERVIQLLETIPQAVASGDHTGCLLCSAAAGPASYDVEIAAQVHKSLDKMRNAFTTALGNDALSDLLLTQYIGMRIQSRSNTTPQQLLSSVTALQAMKP
jgi:TetR/AcrR family transcriptional repressor of nem operon